MSLIRRKSLPKLIKTSEIAARWGKSSERVRQILKQNNCRAVQTAPTSNAAFGWYQTDVERVEAKIFGAAF